jgi:sphingolipid delta-4 desaturase
MSPAFDDNRELQPGGFELRFHWRILGSHAPMFPGFEIDICDKVADSDKPDAVWHRNRSRAMLKSHPEIKLLFGRSRWTAAWCLLLASAQVSVALAAPHFQWWMIVGLAYIVGAMANVGLFNLAHECNHGLVFKRKSHNRWLFTLTSLPMMLPAHHTWWIEHHVHHNELGAKQDFVKRRRSILLHMKDRVFGKPISGWLRRCVGWLTTPLFWPVTVAVVTLQYLRELIGLFVYAAYDLPQGRWRPSDFTLRILADGHLVSGYRRYGIEFWAVVYPVMSLGLTGLVFAYAGWAGLTYLFLSSFFSGGLWHPLAFGLLLNNSHFHGFKTYQPSSSYYGWLNWITFNFGLHTEHHDLANIPWYRLGRLRELAPEYYEPLKKTTSFTALAIQFAFCSRGDFDNEEHRNRQMLNTG